MTKTRDDELHELEEALRAVAEPVVFAWRLEVALRLGFDEDAAAELADSRVDLHDLDRRLLRRGCAHDVALLIVL